MKVQKITLKEVEFVEVEGEYEKRFINKQNYPAFLTNYALKKGQEEGLITSSIIADIVKFQALDGLRNEDNEDLSALEQIDQTSIHKVIYMAFKGANPKEKLTFDDFLQKYHDSLAESMELYTKLVVDVISQDPNQFATALKKVQIAAVTVKKVKNPDIKIECVEDKYVLYCLVSGIDPETFWHEPISSVERIYAGITAFEAWRNDPK